MKIMNINRLNFGAAPVKSPRAEKQAISTSQNIKDILYNDIDGYLNKKYSKMEYFNRFVNNLKNFEGNAEFSQDEKKYINNLLTVLDINGNPKAIPDEYLEDLMKELISQKI